MTRSVLPVGAVCCLLTVLSATLRSASSSSASSACAARTAPTTSSSRSTTTAAPTTPSRPRSGTGYGVAASDGVARCVIPNGTVIPNRGHYLCVNSVGYTSPVYPAGNGTTATGDATYTTDIPDNAGIALFNTNTGGGNFIARQPARRGRLDQRGQHALQGGHGLPGADAVLHRLLFYRDDCGKSGSITTFGACPITHAQGHEQQRGRLRLRGHQRHVGGRGPAPRRARPREPLVARSSATPRSAGRRCSTRASAGSSPPNRVRDFTSDPANNSTFGTLDIRRTVVNNTGGNVTRLRFRIIDLTTFPAPSGHRRPAPAHLDRCRRDGDRPPCGSGHVERHRAGDDAGAAAHRSRTAAASTRS